MSKTRPLLFIVTILLLAATVFSYVFFDNNFLIRKWHIPLSPPGFLDARQMGWAAESYAMGYDPLVENPANWRGHQLNYPRIWQLIFSLGIDSSHTNLIGTISVIIFFIGYGLFWFSKKFDTLTCFILTIAVFSSAVMLALERANIELILFCVISLALLVNYSSRVLGLSIFIFASVLKMYPIFGFFYLLNESKKKFFPFFLTGTGIFVAYMLFTLVDTMRVYSTTPQLPGSSMGMNVWWLGLNNRRFFDLHISADGILYLKAISYITVILIVAGALYWGVRSSYADRLRKGEFLEAFRTGAGIYLGCFIMIINADYRLIFLILTIPQIVSWLQMKGKRFSPVPLITLSAIIISLWSSFIMRFLGRNPTFILEESCNWIIFAGLLYLFFASVPEWLNDYLRQPFSRIKSLRKLLTQ